MKAFLALAALAVAGGVAASASASGSSDGKSVYVRSGETVTLSVRILRPKKIILFGAGPNVKTTAKTVCRRGTKVSTVTRSFDVAGTRNLLYGIPARQSSCTVTVTGHAGQYDGRLTVDTVQR